MVTPPFSELEAKLTGQSLLHAIIYLLSMEAFSQKTDIFSTILKIWVSPWIQFNSIFSFDIGESQWFPS